MNHPCYVCSTVGYIELGQLSNGGASKQEQYQERRLRLLISALRWKQMRNPSTLAVLFDRVVRSKCW